MYYIQNADGQYFYGWISKSPIWSDNLGDAKKYESLDDTASDEYFLDNAGIHFWVLMQ